MEGKTALPAGSTVAGPSTKDPQRPPASRECRAPGQAAASGSHSRFSIATKTLPRPRAKAGYTQWRPTASLMQYIHKMGKWRRGRDSDRIPGQPQHFRRFPRPGTSAVQFVYRSGYIGILPRARGGHKCSPILWLSWGQLQCRLHPAAAVLSTVSDYAPMERRNQRLTIFKRGGLRFPKPVITL
jgi:hypothetical protein